jgi:hypothetical protein
MQYNVEFAVQKGNKNRGYKEYKIDNHKRQKNNPSKIIGVEIRKKRIKIQNYTNKIQDKINPEPKHLLVDKLILINNGFFDY